MTKFKFALLAASIVFLSAFTASSIMDWQITDDYNISFSSDDASGVFTDLKGDILFDEDNLSASVFDVQVAVNSINTGNRMKTRHAKGKKWFNAEAYPTISFSSERFAKKETGYEVTGILNIRGIEKEMTLPFTFNNEIFESSFVVNRTDFNIGANKGMAKKVSKEITLEISVPVSK